MIGKIKGGSLTIRQGGKKASTELDFYLPNVVDYITRSNRRLGQSAHILAKQGLVKKSDADEYVKASDKKRTGLRNKIRTQALRKSKSELRKKIRDLNHRAKIKGITKRAYLGQGGQIRFKYVQRGEYEDKGYLGKGIVTQSKNASSDQDWARVTGAACGIINSAKMPESKKKIVSAFGKDVETACKKTKPKCKKVTKMVDGAQVTKKSCADTPAYQTWMNKVKEAMKS